jgi:hypothetical protein
MKIKNKIIFGIFFLVLISLISFSSADYMRSNLQNVPFTSSQSSEKFDNSMCEAGQDFIIQIAPFGCTPAVVRSDLLEEQNVPIHCQLSATKINPLIDVKSIESISFQGEYPEEVSGIGFHPARAALSTEEDLNHPILNNIGYVTIVLKEQQNTSAMPDFVEGNLTAKLSYEIKNAFGIGDASFYLPELKDEEWENKYNQYSFWGGKGYLRVDDIDEEGAIISLYDSSLNKVSSVALKKGESSGEIFLPGFDCLAGLKLKLIDVKNPDTRTKLRVDGDVIEVSQGEKFLENKCVLKSLENKGVGERVSIQCKEDDGKSDFDLEIKPKLKLDFDNENEEGYEVGDWLYDTEHSRAVYLGYIGTYGNTGKTEDLYVYLVEMKKKDKLSEEDLNDVNDISNFFVHKRTTGVAPVDILTTIGKAYAGAGMIIQKFYTKGMEIKYLSYDYLSESGKIEINSAQEIFGKQIKIEGFAISQNKELNAETENNYQKAMGDYDIILESFSTEEYSDEINYGKKVLTQKIILAGDMAQKETVAELCEDFKKKYFVITPELKEKGYCDNQYKLSSSEDASETVMINGNLRKISFEGIYEPSPDEFSVKVFVKGNGSDYTGLRVLQNNGKLYLSDSEYISLKEIGEDYAVFDLGTVRGLKESLVSSNLKVDLKDYQVIGENYYEIRVDEIKLKKTAKVSVTPNINNAGTEANFSFKIGIEKRAIQLSPEKTKEIIKDLNETIGQWTDISESLGQAVKGLKTACLTTGVVLTAKNLFANADGKSIARQEVMRGEGGWYEQCSELVSVSKEYSSIEECMYKNGDKIDKEVNDFYGVLQEQNKDIKNLQEGITEKKFLSEDVVNTDEFMKKYSSQVQEYLEENTGDIIEDPDGKAGSIETAKVINTFSYSAWKDNKYSLEQLRDIELYTKILESEPNNEMAQKRLYSLFAEVQTVSETYAERQSFADKYGVGEAHYGSIEKLNEIVLTEDLTFASVKNYFSNQNIAEDKFVQLYKDRQTGKEFLFVLDNDYIIEQTYLINGNQLQFADENNINPLKIGFKKYDASSYKNNFKSSAGETTYVVRYYETEPYKGLPAVVPFDLNDGWYAATKQTLPIGGNIRSYDASGAVNSFWLCNVGANGIEEFKTTGDDMCEMINKGTGQPYNQFAGLSEDEAKKRINAGEKAIDQASKQYSAGVTRIKIDVGYGVINLNVGSPAVDIPDMQCQDFMSPKDCQLLFNVCDPVICPSSRCDFGGAYPVKDVIQSGIIGSIALCLPNVKEGIIIPVCLTGVQAGIDGLVSISTSYRDCLQESLETGEMVGVCDEIYSIYMCEFLWRQALPLAQIAIPKMMEWMLGQDIRGGGEYLGVENSLDNAEKSINYFTQFYGESSSKAFKARTTEEVGGEVCKVYVSGIYPAGGNLLDSLTEPDSPSQFHGRFDEIPFTTATVPATSHYKVFYHIYSGKDSGAYYKVYLKGATETSFYQDVSSSRIVSSGYILAGGYASETKDFTAPSGYQQMCIMVNNQEECGFKQISTDFAINYVTDKYLEEQTTKTQIKTESECISGSASVYSLLTPNIQEGVGDVINPEIYNRGIIRVCATNNPGQGTDAYAGGDNSRWVEVGYCDDEKIKCWIDTQSVKEVIKNTDIEGDALDEVTENQLDILRNKEGYISSDDFENLKKEIKGLIEDKKYDEAINKVDESFDFVFLNDEKANLLLLRGDAYAELATEEKLVEDRKDKIFGSEDDFEVDEDTIEESEEEGINEEGDYVEEDTKRIVSEEDKTCDVFCKKVKGEEFVGVCEEFGIGKSICSSNGEILEGNYCEGDSIFCCCSTISSKEAENFEEVVVDEGYISPRFEVELWITGVADVNYRYFNQRWYWSFGTEKWTSLNNFVDQGVTELPDQHKLIVEKLRGKDYLDGVHVLLDSLSNPNGLFVPKLNLRQSIISKEKIFDDNYQFVFAVNDYIGQESSYFVYYSGKWYTTFNKLFFPSWIPVADVDLDESQHLASWVIENKNYEKVIKYKETFNLLNSLKNKGFDSGMIAITNTFYEVSAEGIIQEKEIALRDEINGADFSEVQKQIILAGKGCNSCNNWINKGCTKEVCEFIGIQIGAGCFYELKEDYYGTGEPEYICVEVKWEKTNEPSKNYDLESALEKIEELSEWYGTMGLPTNFNYETKQFVWDLYLNKILTEKEYNNVKGNFFLPRELRDLKKILQTKLLISQSSGGAH